MRALYGVKRKERIMASKKDIVQALARMEELAREVGIIGTDEALILGEAEAQFGIPWSVLLLKDGYQHTGALPHLPDSGCNIGRTKSEALHMLRSINGTLSVVLRTPRPVRKASDLFIA
jgi:hypothetical protein